MPILMIQKKTREDFTIDCVNRMKKFIKSETENQFSRISHEHRNILYHESDKFVRKWISVHLYEQKRKAKKN